MDDLISRQAAIAEFNCCELTPDGGIDANYAIDFLERLPSVQPEPKTGEWNFVGNQMFECTSCGVAYTEYQFEKMRVRYNDPKFPRFCPNCGADMRGERDG